MNYRTFTRTWWIENHDWPNGLEPQLGEPDYSESTEHETEWDAQQHCKSWNATHDKGRYSLKMEYEAI